MLSGEYLRSVKLENISQIEFGKGRDTIYYVETNELNRPYCVKKLNIVTQQESTIFVDHEPTHYLDIGKSKDGKYLLINSNTKEDSEVWVLERDEGNSVVAPTLLIPRRPNIRAHVDHLRDFFIMITNHGVKSKNYKLATLKDSELTTGKWEDLL